MTPCAQYVRNTIRANPGVNTHGITRRLADKGYSAKSVSNAITQLRKNGVIERVGGQYYTTADDRVSKYVTNG